MLERSLTKKILMIGNYYKGNATGGMASVARVYEKHYETYNYLSSWRDVSKAGKIFYAVQAYVRAFFILLLNRNIEILHAHVASSSSFYRKAKFIKLGKFFNKKVVFHMHSAIFKDYYAESEDKDYLLQVMKSADKFIALSKSWREWYISIGIDPKKIAVINNPVSEPIHFPIEANSPVRLLFLGELLERKGVWDILRGLKEHKGELKGKVFLKIGGNKKVEELKAYIIDNQLESIVEYVGWVAGEKKWKLLNWANVVILPSFNEGLPITLLEAMAYSCALISTPVGGIPEILKNKENGIMVTPGNSEEIINAIKFFISNTDEIKKMGQKSQELVRPFLPETVFEQLRETYKELVK